MINASDEVLWIKAIILPMQLPFWENRCSCKSKSSWRRLCGRPGGRRNSCVGERAKLDKEQEKKPEASVEPSRTWRFDRYESKQGLSSHVLASCHRAHFMIDLDVIITSFHDVWPGARGIHLPFCHGLIAMGISYVVFDRRPSCCAAELLARWLGSFDGFLTNWSTSYLTIPYSGLDQYVSLLTSRIGILQQQIQPGRRNRIPEADVSPQSDFVWTSPAFAMPGNTLAAGDLQLWRRLRTVPGISCTAVNLPLESTHSKIHEMECRKAKVIAFLWPESAYKKPVDNPIDWAISHPVLPKPNWSPHRNFTIKIGTQDVNSASGSFCKAPPSNRPVQVAQPLILYFMDPSPASARARGNIGLAGAFS
jgi:hypothetical protein